MSDSRPYRYSIRDASGEEIAGAVGVTLAYALERVAFWFAGSAFAASAVIEFAP